jgi:hypothetical protein
MPPSISIVEANTMSKKTIVRSPSLEFFLENFFEFGKHTTGFGLKFLRNMVYDGQQLGIRRQGIIIAIATTTKIKHEGLGFNGRGVNPMIMNFKAPKSLC